MDSRLVSLRLHHNRFNKARFLVSRAFYFLLAHPLDFPFTASPSSSNYSLSPE
jgi:hypothetical protein